MNFLLENIELNIEDALIEEAETLLARKGLSDAIEIEKQLWLAKATKAPLYEAEVQFSGKKIKDYTCDCPEFKTSKMCKHITALLLQVREQLRQREALAVEKKKHSSRLPQRLTVNEVLKNVRQEDLKDFIRNYSRSNHRFALALKTHFAGNIQTENSANKYIRLIEAAIKQEKSVNGFIKPGRQQAIFNFFDHIAGHAHDAISLENLSEAFAIVSAVFEKVPIIRQVFEDPEAVARIFDRFIPILHNLNENIKAPSLKESFYSFCLLKAFESLIVRAGLYRVLLNVFLEKQVPSSWKTQAIHRITGYLVHGSSVREAHIVHFKYYRFVLMDQSADKTGFPNAVRDISMAPRQFYELLQKLLENDRLRLGAKLIDSADKGLFTKKSLAKIEHLRLDIALKRNEPSIIRKLSRKFFIQTFDLKFYGYFRKVLKRHPTEQIDALIEVLQAEPKSEKQMRAIGHVLQTEQRLEELFCFLKKSQSLWLIQQFDTHLFETHKKEMHELYIDLLEDYLERHLGIPASITVRKVLQHLHRSNASTLASVLAGRFRKNYPWRHSLLEELAVF